jgi:hypothetical protein
MQYPAWHEGLGYRLWILSPRRHQPAEYAANAVFIEVSPDLVGIAQAVFVGQLSVKFDMPPQCLLGIDGFKGGRQALRVSLTCSLEVHFDAVLSQHQDRFLDIRRTRRNLASQRKEHLDSLASIPRHFNHLAAARSVAE